MPAALPPRSDLFAFLIFIGMVQGVVLAYFFLKHSRGTQAPNRYLGGLMLGMTLLMIDVWLCYTNRMFTVIRLDDSTEWVNLLISPLFYLYLRTSLSATPGRYLELHLLPSALYLGYLAVLWFPQPEAVPYNAYVDAFHPDLPQLPVRAYGPDWAWIPKKFIIELTMLSMVVYLALGWREVRAAYRRAGASVWQPHPRLSWYRNRVLQVGAVLVVFAGCRLTFPGDLGDHLIAAHMAFVVYATSFSLLRQSAHFVPKPAESDGTPPEPPRKYERSSLTPELEEYTLRKLREVMKAEQPYLDPACSLPGLAARLGVSTHHLSQVLNDRLSQSFFEFLAEYRVAEAQRLLADSTLAHLKLEEIGERVGYASKSAFNGAFKKRTGQTPSEFRRSRVSAGTPGR